MKLLANILRIITGLVFIFSGFVKAVDPVGTQIKFEDYFNAMGLDFLTPTALFFSFMLNAAEFILGLMLVLNAFPLVALVGALIFMIIFTPLTLWLAVANPVSDCGCFGDAVELTNWETFWKNVVFLAFIIFAYFFGSKENKYTAKQAGGIVLASTVLVFAFQTYNLRHLPVIDFRPFKEGANIKEKIIIPPDAPRDVYETKLYYINNSTGERKEFTLEESPYDDPENWTFDTTINKLVSRGYEPPIQDFVLSTEDGVDMTDDFLSNPKYAVVMVLHDMQNVDKRRLSEIERISDFCEKNNMSLYILTAAGRENRLDFNRNYNYKGSMFTADKTMLKTIARSNPAWLLMKQGVLIKKWHFRDLPNDERLQTLIKK